MAQSINHRLLPLLGTFLVLASAIKESQAYSKTLSPPPPALQKQEKLTHLHFYFHDIISGNKPTAATVVNPSVANVSTNFFGLITITDDPLTERPDINSKVVGRAQGLYIPADMREVGLLMVMNFLFTEGEFKGSYVSLLGRNPIMSAVREMPIVGGSGAFRFARGYAEARTVSFRPGSGNAVVEYHMYIWHY